MGRLFLIKLEGKVYSCKHCQTHLAISDDIVWKSFCCHREGYVFNNVSNVDIKEEPMTAPGKHTISDVFCVRCGASVGWKYAAAHEIVLARCAAKMFRIYKIGHTEHNLTGPDGS